MIGNVVVASLLCAGNAQQPAPNKKAASARYMVHSADYVVLATISKHLNGAPFGNVITMSDGPVANSTGHLYFYASELDTSIQDVALNPAVSVTISEAQIVTSKCATGAIDPEDPTCARLTISGNLKALETTGAAAASAQDALFSRHPDMKQWPGDHGFAFYELDFTQGEIWLINFYGGATVVPYADYMANSPSRRIAATAKSNYLK